MFFFSCVDSYLERSDCSK